MEEYAKRMARMRPPAPATPVEPLPEQIKMSDLLAEQQRDVQRRCDEATARNQLQVQPPQPAEPVLELLPDGTKPLALDAVPNRHHSVTQLKDFLARKRAAS